MSKQIAINWITENESLIIDVSDKIWEYAELMFQEYKSSKLIADVLEKHGFKVERGVAGMPTALVATWGSGKPIIGVQGEYDALPELSQKPIPYKEPLKEGAPGHGCGHNVYGSSGVGGVIAAKVAMEAEGIQGTVKFFGTPAEEGGAAKVFMVRDGVYDGVDVVIYHHPSIVNSCPLESLNAMNSTKFVFYGKASHAGITPWQGRSALDAVELMDVGVQFMREHIIPQARIHHIIEKGGMQPNVVPAIASNWYYVRAPTRDSLNLIYNWLCEIAEGAAKMTQTRLEEKFQNGTYHLLTNRTLAELVVKNMREIGTPIYTEEELSFARKIGEQISPDEKRNSGHAIPDWEDLMEVDLNTNIIDPYGEGTTLGGSADSSDVSWIAPLVKFETGSHILGASAHSWMNVAVSGMSIGHKNAIFASKVHASTILDLLTKPEVLRAAWEEFEKKKGGRKYKSPLPPDLKPNINQFAFLKD